MNLLRQVSLVTFLAAGMAAQTTPVWKQKSPPSTPSPRSQHAMAYDAARGQVVLFGGFDDVNGFVLGDTWVWDGSTWTRKSPQTVPVPRFGHSMVYDAAHAQVVLFGGTTVLSSGSLDLNDTWVWDGSNWTRKTPQTSPPPREAPSMAYDAGRGEAILFGGVTGNISSNCVVPLAETWAWDGANWSKLSPAASPTARFLASMAYDVARGRIVLFGGGVTECSGQPATVVNDTWTWDGVNWSKQSPATSPTARYEQAMTYDLAGGQVVLFGGANSRPLFAPLGDTWTWDGANWSQKGISAPVARYFQTMAFDYSHGQTVLFGGLNNNSLIPDYGDTWTLDSSGAGPAIANVITAAGYGAFSATAPGSWIEVYGSNLSNTTRPWAGTDFTGISAPTALDGVQVSIGGQKAFVEYIGANPGQVNAQVPSNISPGPQPVTVTNAGVTSTPISLTVNAAEPGLLAPASFQFNGIQYAVAQSLDGTFLLPPGSIAGVNSRPAIAGETIVIYGVGFGPVIPDMPAGQIVTQDNHLAAPIEFYFGTATASTSFAGLARQYVGLYQFNIVVPQVPGNSMLPLTFTLGGVPSTQTLYIAVQ